MKKKKLIGLNLSENIFYLTISDTIVKIVVDEFNILVLQIFINDLCIGKIFFKYIYSPDEAVRESNGVRSLVYVHKYEHIVHEIERSQEVKDVQDAITETNKLKLNLNRAKIKTYKQLIERIGAKK